MKNIAASLFIVIGTLCGPISAWSANPVEAEKSLTIAELIGKKFRVTISNGARVVSALPAGRVSYDYLQRDGKRCEDNVAWLDPETGDKAAISIESSPLILAFLGCPAGTEDVGWIVSLFDYHDTNSPKCNAYIDLLTKPGYFYSSGGIHSLSLRSVGEGRYFVGVVISGGDAGDSWYSIAFLHLNSQCQITPVAKFYTSTHVGDNGERVSCEGNHIDYRFKTNTVVEIESKKLVCTNGVENYESGGKTKYDLEAMFRKPALRIFEPK